MMDTTTAAAPMRRYASRSLLIFVISFLTLADLFATQAILPSLARAYAATPMAVGAAVNACTIGMAVTALLIAIFNRHINRPIGISLSLALLAIPTLLLSLMPDLLTFALLRIAQGVFMAAAFSLTIAHLSETSSSRDAANALAAYVTGNVASNLIGRLISANVADHLGLPANFLIFAALNLAGATLAFLAFRSSDRVVMPKSAQQSWHGLVSNRDVIASLAIGFLILFIFIGTFTYINFILTASPIGLSSMQIGFVYFTFLPAMITTPLAGRLAQAIGARTAITGVMTLTATALLLLLTTSLVFILLGLAAIAVGTFLAQATAAAHIGRIAGQNRGIAGGLYLAAYYAGGLFGTLILGHIFDSYGWPATVAVLTSAALVIASLGISLSRQQESAAWARPER